MLEEVQTLRMLTKIFQTKINDESHSIVAVSPVVVWTQWEGHAIVACDDCRLGCCRDGHRWWSAFKSLLPDHVIIAWLNSKYTTSFSSPWHHHTTSTSSVRTGYGKGRTKARDTSTTLTSLEPRVCFFVFLSRLLKKDLLGSLLFVLVLLTTRRRRYWRPQAQGVRKEIWQRPERRQCRSGHRFLFSFFFIPFLVY